MTAPDDATLLRRYADTRSEEAFGEFVRRHLAFVYATALRRVSGDTHRAEEIAQLVFTRAAQKSAALARHPAIAAWLHTATRYAAADLVRSEQRRRARELAAHSLNPDMHANAPVSDPHTTAAADWEKLRPELDTALDHLREIDRAVILLRFFENHTFPAIAQKLRLTEDAARKRTDRALEKLRAHLARRGLTSTATALSLALTQSSSAAALPPASLAASITTASLSAAAPTLLSSVLTTLAMTKLQTGAILALALASTFGTAFLATLAARQNHTLSTFSTPPIPTHAQTLEALREKIAATEAALVPLRAEEKKRADRAARRAREEKNSIRGPETLFSYRLRAESTLIPFLKEHPLDPALREKLKALIVEESVAQQEQTIKALRDQQELSHFDLSVSETYDRKFRDLLGEPVYHLYREITLGRSAISDIDADLKDADAPLTEAQRRIVAHHYYESVLRPPSESRQLLSSGLYPQQEAFVAGATPHLSPEQAAALRAALQNENRIRQAKRAQK